MDWVSHQMLPRSLGAPHQDLLRPRAQRRPRLWARWWTLCCSYRETWCCRRCRRIPSGKAGREICAKMQQQATLCGWTDIRAQVRELIKHKTVDSCSNRYHQQEDKQKSTLMQRQAEIPDTGLYIHIMNVWATHVPDVMHQVLFVNWHSI